MEGGRRNKKKETPKGKVKPKNEKIKKKKETKKKSYISVVFLYKWSSVIKEVESCPVCPSSRRSHWSPEGGGHNTFNIRHFTSQNIAQNFNLTKKMIQDREFIILH